MSQLQMYKLRHNQEAVSWPQPVPCSNAYALPQEPQLQMYHLRHNQDSGRSRLLGVVAPWC